MIFKMSPIFLLLICFSNGLQAFGQAEDDSLEARKAAADRYFQAVPMESMMHDMTVEVSKTLPDDQRAIFENVLMKKLRIDLLEEAAREALIKHLTAPEINALAAFYSSKEGRSVMKKMGKYMAEIMPVLQRELIAALNTMDQQEKE